MTEPIYDLLGQKLEVGDLVAIAFVNNRKQNGVQRIGTIESFGTRTERPLQRVNGELVEVPQPPTTTLIIDWDKNLNSEHLSAKLSKVNSLDGRIIKLDREKIVTT